MGLKDDSRHSPPFVAMKDVLWKDCEYCDGTGKVEEYHDFGAIEKLGCSTCEGTGKVYDEERAWDLIAKCPINQFWSAGIGVFRGQLRAWFCEIAMAQSILHQDEPDYPDTGLDPTIKYETGAVIPISGEFSWWQLPMRFFRGQVRKHCHECSVPLQGFGELAQSSSQESREQVSQTHAADYKPKRQGRRVELVTTVEQLGKPLERMTAYIQNAKK